MLACARIGAVHSVVFGGFAASELAVRVDDAAPKAILAASCGIEPGRVIAYKPMIDEAIELSSNKPDFTVILQREQAEADLIEGRDFEWRRFRTAPRPPIASPSEAPIRSISSTLLARPDSPRAWCARTPGIWCALMDHDEYLRHVAGRGVLGGLGCRLGRRPQLHLLCALLHGCTTVVYEGKPVGTPDAGAFWRMIAEYDIKVLFTAPTAFRAIKRQDPEAKLVGDYDLSSLRALFLAGERADPDTIEWAKNSLGVPVIDHWWQTETGYAIAGNPIGWSRCRSNWARPPSPCRATTCRSSTRAGMRSPLASWGRLRSSCRCRRAHCRRFGTRKRGSGPLI